MPRPNSLDLNWFRAHLVQDILPHWLEGAATPAGLFFPRLDRQWRRQPDQVATLVSQSRLLYNFANGYEATGDEPYLQAVRNGARYLIDHFRDPEHGGWFFSVAPPSVLDAHPEAAIVPEVDRARALPGSAAVLDDRKDSYGHAFVVFGLAHAAQCTGDDAYRQAAADTWATIQAKLTDEHGGLKLRTSGIFSPASPDGSSVRQTKGWWEQCEGDPGAAALRRTPRARRLVGAAPGNSGLRQARVARPRARRVVQRLLDSSVRRHQARQGKRVEGGLPRGGDVRGGGPLGVESRYPCAPLRALWPVSFPESAWVPATLADAHGAPKAIRDTTREAVVGHVFNRCGKGVQKRAAAH